MDKHLAQDLDNFDVLLRQTGDYAAQLLGEVTERPAAVAPVSPDSRALPVIGQGFAATLADFRERWAPGFAGTAGPRYLGFVTGGVTPASLAGDWLTGTLDQNPTSSLDSSAPDLERETVDWLRQIFNLNENYQGSFVTGATQSNMVGLAIAREWVAEQHGLSVAEHGLNALGPVKVFSGSPHSSIYKGLSVLGLGRQALTQIPCLSKREAVDVYALERALSHGADQPVIVVANAGTVNTVDFDDLTAIAALKKRYRFWLHVDAAFGGFAALVPEKVHWVQGMNEADSICIDCHKWLNVPYDSAVQFTRRRDLQLKVFQNAAAYLGEPTKMPDFVHLTPENSRRLRALAAWFSLSAYGAQGHRDIVERNIAAANQLGKMIDSDPHLKLLAPVYLNVVCFSLRAGANETRIKTMVNVLRDAGEAFLTPTTLHGNWALRAAFSNWRTTEADVTRVFVAIRGALSTIE